MLKKDIIELSILQLLSSTDMYGYEILQHLSMFFPHMQESALYILLRGLAREGYAQCYEGDVSEGPVRKYYRITQSGNEKRNKLTQDWRELRNAIVALGIE